MQGVADAYVGQKCFAGVEWAVMRDGARIFEGQSGAADAEGKTPIPDKALYRIFSMTKPIVSMLALMMVERGRLRLYEPVSMYIPAFGKSRVLTPEGYVEPPVRPITIEDLLTHRAGLSYGFILGCHVAPYYRDERIFADMEQTLAEVADQIATLPLAFHPGTKWRYSVATDILARVLEVAGGASIDALLQEMIFAPLGLDDTSYHVPEDQQHRIMPLYGQPIASPRMDIPDTHPLDLLDADAFYPPHPGHVALRGGHGLFSTAADYLTFAEFLRTGTAADGTRLISRKMHDMMQVNRLTPDQMPINISLSVLHGYGWGLTGRVMVDLGKAPILTGDGEFGWSGAGSTYFWVDPAERMSGVVMAQYTASHLPLGYDMHTAAYQALD